MEKKKSLTWYKNKEKPKNEKIYNGSWEAKLLFKARTDSLEVNEKNKKWGGNTDLCEKCQTKSERIIETLEHLLVECPEYEEDRKRFESEMITKIGNREWEETKQSEDKGITEILGLGKYGKKVTDVTKKYLSSIWTKRNKTNKGQKIKRSGNINNYKTTEIKSLGDQIYYKELHFIAESV